MEIIDLMDDSLNPRVKQSSAQGFRLRYEEAHLRYEEAHLRFFTKQF